MRFPQPLAEEPTCPKFCPCRLPQNVAWLKQSLGLTHTYDRPIDSSCSGPNLQHLSFMSGSVLALMASEKKKEERALCVSPKSKDKGTWGMKASRALALSFGEVPHAPELLPTLSLEGGHEALRESGGRSLGS